MWANHHVAGNGKYFSCTLSDKTEIEAVLVGTDALTDLAVLQLAPSPPRTFPAARFGDSSKLRVGDRVYAIGSPLTFDQSVTEGVVSNTALTKPEILPDEWFMLDGENVGAVLQWIGHDADIFGGNSGGPLVNTRGEIIGINEVSFGLGGAIPSNLVKEISQVLIVKGELTRSWIGVTAQPLLDSSPLTHGALITGALAGSPAEQAGFMLGDILLRIRGKPVDVRVPEDLPPFNVLLMSLPVGQPAEAVVWRAGAETTLTVTPAARPKAKHRPQEFLQWGFCASDLSLLQARELKREGVAGALIVSLRPGGPADNAKPALRERDVLVEAAGEPVRSVADLRAITTRVTEGRQEPVPVLVTVERRAERLRTVVEVGVTDIPDPGREVSKAWAPVGTQVLTRELAKALSLADTTGVCVTQVYPKTTAQAAGLQVGDIITALDGQPVPASRPEHAEVFAAAVRRYRIGATVSLTVLRKGETLTIPIELEASPPLPREMRKYRDEHYEFTARDLAFKDRVDYGWPEGQQGALVESVSSGGWAALGHLESGDLILAIDGASVPTVEALDTVMARVREARPRRVVVLVKRGIRNLFLEWRAKWATEQ